MLDNPLPTPLQPQVVGTVAMQLPVIQRGPLRPLFVTDGEMSSCVQFISSNPNKLT